MREAREKGEDIYCGQRDTFIDQNRYERALETSKYKADMIFELSRPVGMPGNHSLKSTPL